MRRSRQMFLLEGVYFISFCALYAYTVTILLDYGYTEVQCGYITMLQYLVMMIAGPVYGSMIDRGLSPKRLFMILLLGGIVVTPMLPFCFARGFSWAMVSFGTISALDFCGASVIDAWINQMTRRDASIDYGVIRSAGSIFYAAAALAAGYLIAPLGVNFLFWLHMGALILAVLLAWPLPEPALLPLLQPEEESAAPPKESLWTSAKTLLGCRPYLIFLLCGTLYYFATRSVNGYMQVIINYIGGDASTYGLSVFLYCVGEFLLMRLASRLLRRMSIGFAGFLRFNIDYVASLFPARYSGRAILVSVAVTQGLGCIFGNLAGGYLLTNVGVPGYCLLCGALLFLALGIFLAGKPFSPKRANL